MLSFKTLKTLPSFEVAGESINLVSIPPPLYADISGDWSESYFPEQYSSTVLKMTVLHIPECRDDDDAVIRVLLVSPDGEDIRDELIEHKLAKPSKYSANKFQVTNSIVKMY